jgi:hypothetical protein
VRNRLAMAARTPVIGYIAAGRWQESPAAGFHTASIPWWRGRLPNSCH